MRRKWPKTILNKAHGLNWRVRSVAQTAWHRTRALTSRRPLVSGSPADIVVSTAPHDPRLHKVAAYIQSIGSGTLRPGRTVLTIDEYDRRPRLLQRMVDRGLDVLALRKGARMAPCARFNTDATTISAGLANLAIVEHSISHPDIDLKLAVIEKRMPRTRMCRDEFLLYRSLEDASAANVQMGPCPQVLTTGESDEYFSVVMPRYSGVNRRLADEDLHGRLIAASVHELNCLQVASLPAVNRMKKERMRVASLAKRGGRLRGRSRLVVDLVDATMPHSWKDEVVQSHNDLCFPNIATEEFGGGHNIVLIDFGLSGRNNVGAEFHHFVRAAHQGQVGQRLLDSMIGHYAELCAKPEGLLVFNAYRYALLRSVSRAFACKRNGQEVQLTEELGIIDSMLRAAHEILDEGRGLSS